MGWRHIAAIAALPLQPALSLAQSPLPDRSGATARPLWIASPVPRVKVLPEGERIAYDHESVRQTIRVQAAAASIRLRLTNELGDAPIAIGRVSVAVIRPDGTPGAARDVRFAGSGALSIEPGNLAISDSLAIALPAFADLAVTVYYPGPAPVVAHRTRVRIAPGDTQPQSQPMGGPAIVSAIETDATPCGRIIVALGDSITQGVGAQPNEDWPSALARRLAGGRCAPTVVNAGIGGNQLYREGRSKSLLARFDRDVLSVPGVTDILLIEGINDIRNWDLPDSDRHGTARVVLDAYRQIVERAHAHGIRVIGGTLTPYGGNVRQAPTGLAIVETVNAAIRAGTVFDGYVDFNRAVADPADPRRMRADVQSGDWLHPNGKGYAAMAGAVPARLFAAPARGR